MTAVSTTTTGREIRESSKSGKFEVQPYGDNYWIECDTIEEAQRIGAPPVPTDPSARLTQLLDLIEEDVASAQSSEEATHRSAMLRRVRVMIREAKSLVQ